MTRTFSAEDVRRLGGLRYREIVCPLGFALDRRAAGSREIRLNAGTKRDATIPNHPGDMPEATLRAMVRQAAAEPEFPSR